MTAPLASALDALAASRAWARADLSHKLSRRQRRAVCRWRERRPRRYALVWTRRGGKSRVKCVIAIEESMRTPNFIVKFGAPTLKEAHEIVVPLMQDLLSDAPQGLVKFNMQQLRWTFSNGSTIKLSGCDGLNANRLRGTAAHLVIVDEAGFATNLTYVIESVLRPQLITTGGCMLLSSTPPATPAHPFQDYAAAADARGDIDVCTLDDVVAEPDSHISKEEAEDAIREAGGRDHTTCKREYFCRFETDEMSAVLPEWNAHRAYVAPDVAVEPPMHRTLWVAADFGFSDLTFAIFAWTDWERARLVVEDELVFEAKGALTVGHAIMRKEREIWPGLTPALRVADAGNQLLATLHEAGCSFAPVVKTDADAALSMLRNAIQTHRVVVNPKCSHLRAHCAHAIWGNKQRTTYARSAGLGHFDGVDALKYLVRHADIRSNPTPALPPGATRDTYFALPQPQNDFASQWRRPRR
jgi:hypothetical protein